LLSFKSAFWALFGLGNPDYVLINDFRNQLTENFGTILYGSYHIAAIIVLLNMLVASMTQSFEKILVCFIYEKIILFLNSIILK
jgi:transient receptor potential cation channel subfamily C protein 4